LTKALKFMLLYRLRLGKVEPDAILAEVYSIYMWLFNG